MDSVSRISFNGMAERRLVFIRSENHGEQVLNTLQNFREQNMFFDFTIFVKEEKFQCHRCILAACSDFFRAMFEVHMRERDDGSVKITNLSPEAVKAFLDFAYKGYARICETNVEMYFQMSSFLQVSLLAKGCGDYLIKKIDVKNCFQILSLSESYGSTNLYNHALQFLVKHFFLLSKSNDFLEINVGVLEKCLEADALNVPDEDTVLNAVLQWTQYEVETREKHLPCLINLVKLHQLSKETLENLMRSEGLLANNPECMESICNVFDKFEEHNGLLTDARPSTIESYIFVHKTEENSTIKHTFCYNIKTDTWKELPAANIIDFPGSSLVVYGEKIFITGGCQISCSKSIRLHIAERCHDATDQTWCYCPRTNNFTSVSSMKNSRTMHSSVVAMKQLFVIGGKTRGAQEMRSLLNVESYNPLTKEWRSASHLPRGIYYPEASACNDVIYVLGSEVEIADVFNPSLDCFFKYNVSSDQWSELVAEFGQFFHATLVKAVSVNSTLYICDLSTYKVYSFCPETCVWKGEGSFECAGFNAGAVGISDKIYILGGDYAPDEITDEVQVYHSRRSIWEEVSPMPKALTEFHCQVIQFSRNRDPWKN
ncbi:kelch repeat and BTB domain-containing protein 3 [Chiloscyllium plagiosum]|uniref:kelch repeat and BTB domain-containing protein 3 n=1 Tax=Chiloscyllium plagiosum TaxID=36176 RepID=UPI001CB87624|nr:kelch repeat and BTB domain-containing protein 3 [Chiloscyllium plagiosum]XP_043547773.1 kelch repeat and BTB domain-containing protein 3 [Chiloscyllium plagiosum]